MDKTEIKERLEKEVKEKQLKLKYKVTVSHRGDSQYVEVARNGKSSPKEIIEWILNDLVNPYTVNVIDLETNKKLYYSIRLEVKEIER